MRAAKRGSGRGLSLCLSLMAGLLALPACAQTPLKAIVTAENAAGRFNGIVVASVEGQSTEAIPAGRLSKTRKAATLDTPWRLASISKQITAVLVMMSVERKEVSLDTPLKAVLPEFADLPSGNVTVKALVRHQSGLPDPSETPANADGVAQFYSHDKADHGFCRGPLRADPEAFHYNNCDYYLLSDVLEKVTGRPFAQLLEERISGPLGLKTLRLYQPGDREPFTAVDSDGAPEPVLSLSVYEAAAGIKGSARDLMRFDTALMSGRLLSRDSLKALWEGEPSLGYVALGAWAYTVKPTGCAQAMTVVERRGAVGNVQTLNLIWPERQGVIIAFSRTAATDWGQLWQDKGFMRDLVVAAWCR
ncbi:serine hydrolase domain-containing protein [Asticcacaulis sp. DW145]|uniref:serine hydrolase domain-containing protein n=1 Tax=Asticcacaulis sp. DW145 TaxID=3095608 RepID=UPI0030D0A23A